MKKISAGILSFALITAFAGCSSDAGSDNFKSFEFENVSKMMVISVDGKRFEVTDTDMVQKITENIESVRFEKGRSNKNLNGFGPFVQWYDTNDELIESISVMGDQTIIYDGFLWTAENGNIDVELFQKVFTEVSDKGE